MKKANLEYELKELISLTEAVKLSNFSRSYLNVLIRREKLKAVKQGKDWFTTATWLFEYQALKEVAQKNYILLSEAAELLNTTPGYLNVLVDRRKLRAVKIGRNWFTTLEWLEQYQKSVGRLTRAVNTEEMPFDLAKQKKLNIESVNRKTEEELFERLKRIESHVSNLFVSSKFKEPKVLMKIEKEKPRFNFKLALSSTLISLFLIISLSMISNLIPNLNFSKFKELGISEYRAAIISDIFQGFPQDLPQFSKWVSSLFQTKPIQELVVDTLKFGESKILKPEEVRKIDTLTQAETLDASGPEEAAPQLADGSTPLTTSGEFTLIENRLSVVEANLKEQNALTQTELSLQKKTILGTLETLIGISKLLPTHPVSTIVVQGSPATQVTYAVTPSVHSGFDRLSASYLTLSNNAEINGSLTVKSGGTFNSLSVSGATTLTGGVTIGGTLNVAGDSTLANVTVNGIFTAPNVSLTNASTTYLTVSNTAWIKEIFATQNLSVATTSATNALTVQGNTFLYGGLGVGMATTTTGAIQTSGDVFVGRNLYVSGNSTTIGQSSSDTLVVNSSIGSNLVPTLNNWYNLGSPSFYWGTLYVDTLNANNISGASTTISGTQSNDFTINSDNASVDQENMNLIFYRGTVPPNAVINWNAATSSKRFEFNQATKFFNESASTTNPVLTVQGNTGLTANAFQVLDVSTSTTLFSVNPVSQKTTMVNASTTNLTVSGNLWAGSSGAFLLADGTVSSPALAFAADTDTGLFRLGDGKMSFTTNATTSLTLDTGKVIVGNDISTASYQLEVADRDTNNNTVVDELRLAHYTTGTAGNGLGTGLLFYGQDAEGAGQNLARIAAVVEQATSSATFKSGLAFYTVGSGGLLEKMRIDNSGNVGIGTTTPASQLSVVSGSISKVPLAIYGASGQTADIFQAATSSAATAAFVITSAGQVGIGTTSPTELLSVSASSGLSGYFSGSVGIGIRPVSAYGLYIGPSVSTGLAIAFGTTTPTIAVVGSGTITLGDDDSVILAKDGGSVGVGTSNAQHSKLNIVVAGNAESGAVAKGLVLENSASVYPAFPGTGVALTFTTPSSIGAGLDIGHRLVGQYVADTYNGPTDLYIQRSTDTGAWTTDVAFGRTGLVGIGTSSPANGKLEVLADMNAALALRRASAADYTGIRIFNDQNSTARALEIDYSGSAYATSLLTSGPTGESASIGTTGAYPLAFGTNNTARMTITSTGNVGIGTTSPNSLGNGGTNTTLEVFKASGQGYLSLTSDLTADNSLVGVLNFGTSGASTNKALGSIQMELEGVGTTNASGNMRFYTRNGGTFGERMVIQYDGNVGIGTTTPTQLLTISKAGVAANANIPNGWLCVDDDGGCVGTTAGTIYAKGGTVTGSTDVAENYYSTDVLEAGEIVQISTKSDRSPTSGDLKVGLQGISDFVIEKATSTSQTIIGIVSTAPGVLLGYDMDNRANDSVTYPVALAGRVPVKVSLENGPIAIGNRISASSVPGVGMKMTAPTTSGVGAPTESVGVGIALEPYDGTQGSPTSEPAEVELPPGVGKILVFVNLGEPRLAASQGTGDLASMVTANSDLNLNGFSILNVKSITGMNGLWRIDEGGNLVVQDIKTQTISSAKGLTTYDEDTGQPYCIKIKGGQIVTLVGYCQDANANNIVPEQITNNPTATTTPTMETTTTSTPTSTPTTGSPTSAGSEVGLPLATTTEPILVEPIVATTTEPVIVSTTTVETATTTP